MAGRKKKVQRAHTHRSAKELARAGPWSIPGHAVREGPLFASPEGLTRPKLVFPGAGGETAFALVNVGALVPCPVIANVERGCVSGAAYEDREPHGSHSQEGGQQPYAAA